MNTAELVEFLSGKTSEDLLKEHIALEVNGGILLSVRAYLDLPKEIKNHIDDKLFSILLRSTKAEGKPQFYRLLDFIENLPGNENSSLLAVDSSGGSLRLRLIYLQRDVLDTFPDTTVKFLYGLVGKDVNPAGIS